MSQPVSAWFQTAYQKGATQKLQSRGFLMKGMTAAPVRFVGNQAVFRVVGRGSAQPLSRAWEKAEPMNAARDTVTLTLTDWQAADVIKHPDINRMDVAEQAIIQESAAMALGRKFDDIHMETFDAMSLPAGQIIGDGTTAIDLLKVVNARGRITSKGILGSREIFCPLPSRLFNTLKIYKQFSTSDWTGDHALAMGAPKKLFDGVTYFEAPDELFTYDTGRGATASATATWVQTYMWLRDSIGFGSTYGLNSKITWENQYTGYFCNNWMDAGVKPILDDAIIRLKFTFAEPSALPA